MEKELKLKTKDGHIIYGTWRIPNKASKKIVIFVHGLTGHRNEAIFYNGANALDQAGIASFRFNLYGFGNKARQFDKTGLSDHARDIERVVAYFSRRGCAQIYLVGHSLGAPSILLADLSKVTALILWDPTDDKNIRTGDWARYDRRIKSYVISWGIKYIWGTKATRERLAAPDLNELLAKHNKPTLIIAAGKGILVKPSKKYLAKLAAPKRLHVINKATHCFDEEGAQAELFSQTLKWVKRFAKY